jgi:hypothetical protein
MDTLYRHRVILTLALMCGAAIILATYLQRNHPTVSRHDAYMAGCQADGLHKIVCASYWWKAHT